MHPKYYPPSSKAFRPLQAMAVLAFIAIAGILFGLVGRHQSDVADTPRPLPRSTTYSATPLTGRSEILSRLQEILQIREDAYRLRNPEMLQSIYSEDCPCLASDEKAINELLERHHRWAGIATSIEVRSVKRVNERIWSVVALFRSERLRIVTSSGALVRAEPAGNDLFQFTLVKPQDSQQWLLALATVLETNR
jgi:hypothetical protein